MTAARRLHRLALLVAAAALLVPTAAAMDGRLSASSASYHGGADLGGEAVAFFLSEDPNQADGPRPVAKLDIQAGRLEALLIERHYLVDPEFGAVGTPLGEVGPFTSPVQDPRYDPNQAPRRVVLEDAHARLDKDVVDMQMHLIPAASTVPFTAHGESGQVDSLSSLVVDAGRFEEAQALDADDRGDENPEFWAVRHDGAVVRHQDLQGTALTFTGDMVLEFLGGTLDARDRDERVLLESGVWREPFAPTPEAAFGSDPLDSERIVLLRVFLSDATVRLDLQGTGALSFLASPDLTTAPDGEATLLGASGSVQVQGRTVTLDDEPFTIPAGNVLDMRPGQDALDLGVQSAAATQAAGPVGSPASSLGLQVGALAGVLAVAGVLALVLLRRGTGPADLRAVEAAIEHGEFGRAARLAKRVLRAQPGLEDAVLGRAIALSRGGRAGAAIGELHAHLASHGASDGSLHYVLGLSFLDVGRMADARAALEEAVRLTPALAGEVQARLGTQGSSSHQSTPVWEVHGYA